MAKMLDGRAAAKTEDHTNDQNREGSPHYRRAEAEILLAKPVGTWYSRSTQKSVKAGGKHVGSPARAAA